MAKETYDLKGSLKETDNIASFSERNSRNISIWIDNYDDIFSDFDPRSFSERNVSDDFLNELKKVFRENNFNINELRLLVPERNRNEKDETTISKRLHAFFRTNFNSCRRQVIETRRKGFLFIIASIFLLIGASYVSSLKSENIFMHALLVLLEPSGWFFIWRGFENLMDSSGKEIPELNFYNKIAKSKIVFISINKNTIDEKHTSPLHDLDQIRN